MSRPTAPVGLKSVFKEVLRTKSGIVAFALLIFISALAIIVPFYAPYNVVKAWNNPQAWLDNPRAAAPEWIEILIGKKLPKTLIFSTNDNLRKEVSRTQVGASQLKNIIVSAKIKYNYDDFPSDLKIELKASSSRGMRVDVTLYRPDGDTITLLSRVITPEKPEITIDSSSDILKKAALRYVINTIGEKPTALIPLTVFFAKKDKGLLNPDKASVLKGRYRIELKATTLDPNGDVDAKFVLYGKIFGLAGTDSKRRDLMVGILWGAPVALAFGLIAAVAVTVIQAFFGVISGYFGGRVDDIIQRFTEVMMIIPILPILILISFLYRITIWALLVIVIGFSLVGGTTKVVRSMVPQIKEEQYVLAATSYGAGSWRIIFKHIFPRILPYMLSLIALAVPGYVFLEAALSFLGLGDPVLPTWGKILGDAYSGGAAYHGYWWWILIPAFFIGLTATAFALLGYALDKIVNPKLREM